MAADVGTSFVLIRPDLSKFTGELSKGVTGHIPAIEKRVGEGFKGAFTRIGGVAAAGLGVGALAGAVSSFVTVGAAYEQSMSLFKAATGASAEEMTRAAEVAKELGSSVDLPGVSAAGAASAMTELAKAGLSTADAMGAAEGALQLAIAGQLSEADAAMVSANALMTFGLAATEAGTVTDLLAGAANASSASVGDVAAALGMAGAAMAGAKIPIDDTVTSLALLAKSGIAGSDAGTLLKTAVTRLTAPTDKAAGEMEELGLQVFGADGKFVGMRSIVEQLGTSFGPLSEAQRAQAIATIFGADAQRLANIFLTQGVDAWDATYAAVTREGQAAELAAATNVGLGGALDNLSSTAETVGLALYEKVSPAMTEIVGRATDIIGKLPGAVSAVAGFFRGIANSDAAQTVFANLRDAFSDVVAGIKPLIGPARDLGEKIAALRDPAAKVAGILLTGLSVGIGAVADVIGPVVTGMLKLGGALEPMAPLLAGVSAALLTYRAILHGVSTAQTIAIAAMYAWDAVVAFSTGVTTAFTGAVYALHVGMLLPVISIAAVVAALVGLAVGLVVLYRKNETFRNAVQAAWSAIKAAVSAVASWITGTLWPGITGAFSAIGGAATRLWGAISAAFSAAWAKLSAFAANVAAWMGRVAAIMKTVVKVVTYPMRLALAIYIALWVVLFKGVAKVLGLLWGRIKAVFNTIKGWITPRMALIKNVIVAAWTVAKARVSAILNTVRDGVKRAWTAITTTVTTALNRIKARVSDGWNAVKSRVSEIGSRIKDAARRIWSDISSAVSGALSPIKTKVGAAFSAAAQAISSRASAVRSAASAVWSGVKDAASGIAGSMASIGADIVQGMINGISGMGGRLAGAVSSLVANNVPGPVRDILGMSSPSKLFKKFGVDTIRGFIIGAEDTGRPLARAMQGLARTAADGWEVPTTPPPLVAAQRGASAAESIVGGARYRADIATGDALPPVVRVFIGDRELTDIVRTEVDGANTATARTLSYGGRRAF